MNFTTVDFSSRILAVTLAEVTVLLNAASYAAGGPEFILPLGPKHPSGLTLLVVGRGIDANGYRPVPVTVTTWPPNKPLTSDRQVRVVLGFYGYDGRKAQVSQVIELPEGSASITATFLVPQWGPFSALSIDTFEGGEKLQDLSSDPIGWPNTNGGNWTEARPALLFIDSHAPPRDERLDLVKAFETTATDASPSLTLPDVRQLLSLLPDLDNSRTPRVPPSASIPSTTSKISDTALLTILAARSRAEMLPPAELPQRWIELSQYDVAIISLADLRSMASAQPKQFAALRDWLATGPLLIVYGVGKEFGRLPELEKLLAIPVHASDPILPSLRGWRPPLLGLRTGSSTVAFSEAAEAITFANPGEFPTAPIQTEIQSAADPIYPDRPCWPLPMLPPFVSRPSGTGCVVAITSDNPFPGVRSDWDWILADVSQSHWQSFKRNGFSQQRTNPDYWKLLIPGVGEAPVISYLLLVSLFAVVIGPINYLLLDRYRRLYLLLVTVPAGALLVTASLFAFAVVSDGLTMRLRVRSFADLDQQTGRAAVWSRQSYYAAIAPSRGLHFPDDTTVFPIVYEPRDSRHDRTTMLVWDGEQQLRGGYLSSRTASQFMVCRATSSKEKLVVREGADSSRPPGVENQLANHIKYLVLRDSRGDYFSAKSIRNKAATDLTPVDPAEAEKALLAIAEPVKPDVPHPEFDSDRQNDNIFSVLGIRRYRYGNYDANAGDPLMSVGLLETNLNEALHPASHPLALRSYIAILDRSPLVITGVGPVREEASFHVIRGRY